MKRKLVAIVAAAVLSLTSCGWRGPTVKKIEFPDAYIVREIFPDRYKEISYHFDGRVQVVQHGLPNEYDDGWHRIGNFNDDGDKLSDEVFFHSWSKTNPIYEYFIRTGSFEGTPIPFDIVDDLRAELEAKHPLPKNYFEKK